MKKWLQLIFVLGVVLGLSSPIETMAYGYGYNVEVQAGGYRKGSSQVKKLDYDSAAVTPHSGLNPAYVTHRVRFSVGGGLATEYVDVYRNGVTYHMYYYPNMARKGDYYILATSMDAGQSVSSARVSGLWMP